jgi:hypothetical protein
VAICQIYVAFNFFSLAPLAMLRAFSMTGIPCHFHQALETAPPPALDCKLGCCQLGLCSYTCFVLCSVQRSVLCAPKPSVRAHKLCTLCTVLIQYTIYSFIPRSCAFAHCRAYTLRTVVLLTALPQSKPPTVLQQEYALGQAYARPVCQEVRGAIARNAA